MTTAIYAWTWPFSAPAGPWPVPDWFIGVLMAAEGSPGRIARTVIVNHAVHRASTY